MNTILVPIGVSSTSQTTLQYAIDFAAYVGAKIYLMQAFTLLQKGAALSNIEQQVADVNLSQIKELLAKVDQEGVPVEFTSYNGDVLDGVRMAHKRVGVDLIIVAPKSNDIREQVFLGETAGSMVKHSNIPILVVPDGNTFVPYKNGLLAFDSGRINTEDALGALQWFKTLFQVYLNLLLVKTPRYTSEDLVINPILESLGDSLQTTENTSTFEGILEHFQSNQPDILMVFRRKRNFIARIREKNIILKREFRCTIPLLVLSTVK